MRILMLLLASLGVALLTGGLLAFIFGGWVLRAPLFVEGFGPLSGMWSHADYCFLGAVLASVGSGLATCGLVGLRGGCRA